MAETLLDQVRRGCSIAIPIQEISLGRYFSTEGAARLALRWSMWDIFPIDPMGTREEALDEPIS